MTERIRVLITGSREFTDRSIVAAALTRVWRESGKQPLTVVHGDARGADRLARDIARAHPDRLVEEAHPVTDLEWRPEGPNGPVDRKAGHVRNQRMVEAGASVCLAFLANGAANAGTRSCMAKARAAGIEVREHWA